MPVTETKTVLPVTVELPAGPVIADSVTELPSIPIPVIAKVIP